MTITGVQVWRDGEWYPVGEPWEVRHDGHLRYVLDECWQIAKPGEWQYVYTCYKWGTESFDRDGEPTIV